MFELSAASIHPRRLAKIAFFLFYLQSAKHPPTQTFVNAKKKRNENEKKKTGSEAFVRMYLCLIKHIYYCVRVFRPKPNKKKVTTIKEDETTIMSAARRGARPRPFLGAQEKVISLVGQPITWGVPNYRTFKTFRGGKLTTNKKFREKRGERARARETDRQTAAIGPPKRGASQVPSF